MQKISQIILKLMGWQLDETLPELRRYVMVGYPHTSNWDFIIAMLAKNALNLPLNWVAKHSIFWGPLRPFFIAMGGVPLNRDKSIGFVEKNIKLFSERKNFILAIMPEGTRSRHRRWKCGFYYIAHGAGVPVVLACLDYKNKKISVGKIIWTTGNIEADFEIIKAFYKGIKGLKPENQSDLSIN